MSETSELVKKLESNENIEEVKYRWDGLMRCYIARATLKELPDTGCSASGQSPEEALTNLETSVAAFLKSRGL